MKKLSNTVSIRSALAAAALAAAAVSAHAQAALPQPAPQDVPAASIPNAAADAPARDDSVSYESIFPEISPDRGKIGMGFWEKYWAWAIGALCAAGIAAYFIFRPKKLPPKTPYELAIEAVAAAEADSENLGAKEFAARVSSAVRAYIEARHSIPAPVKTTQEFLKIASESAAFDRAQREILAGMLNSSDMAKFARESFSVGRRAELAALARRFLESDNIRCDIPPEPAAGAPESGDTNAETADAPKMKEPK